MKIGFANGAFDCFHEGHQHFLRACAEQCDYLVLAINSDASVRRLKGEARPLEPWRERIGPIGIFLLEEMTLRRRKLYAIIPFEGREEGLIMEIRPDVIFKGYDHSPTQTHYAARAPAWKNGPFGVWTAPIIHIPKHGDFSTSAIARARGLE